jgi:hypothetical protein
VTTKYNKFSSSVNKILILEEWEKKRKKNKERRKHGLMPIHRILILSILQIFGAIAEYGIYIGIYR